MEPKRGATTVQTEQWVNWVAALIVSSMAAVIFLFNTFVTVNVFDRYREAQIEFSQMLVKRLDRIEVKLDRSINHGDDR